MTYYLPVVELSNEIAYLIIIKRSLEMLFQINKYVHVFTMGAQQHIPKTSLQNIFVK